VLEEIIPNLLLLFTIYNILTLQDFFFSFAYYCTTSLLRTPPTDTTEYIHKRETRKQALRIFLREQALSILEEIGIPCLFYYFVPVLTLQDFFFSFALPHYCGRHGHTDTRSISTKEEPENKLSVYFFENCLFYYYY
jgi:hypothetical protein